MRSIRFDRGIGDDHIARHPRVMDDASMLDLDEAGIRASAERGRNRTKNTLRKDAPLVVHLISFTKHPSAA